MKTEAVFFDLDGTLADTTLDLGAALNQLLCEEKRPPLTAEIIRPHTSNGTRGLIGLGFGLTPEDEIYPELAQRFLKHYAASVCQHTVLFPGIPTLLDTLDTQKIPWGVVTNKPHRFTLPLLAALGLEARCACIVSGDSTPHPKPAPDPLLLACKTACVHPEQTLYVGDDMRDIVAGRAAGMVTVAARWGYLGVDEAPENWGAHYLIDTPEELLSLI